MRVRDVRVALRRVAHPEKVSLLKSFFKTGKGEYGEGDEFLGVNVPDSRKVAKQFASLSLQEVHELLQSTIHEERLTALLILVHRYETGDEKTKQAVYEFYLKHAKRVNNWDLVDLTAPKIVGAHLETRNRKVLYMLARSKNVWERRIAIVATMWFIYCREFADTLKISEILLNDEHDLIHKAAGWMLREVGRKNEQVLTAFLKAHYKSMPRTMLRYAIERFDEQKRQSFLRGRV